jgi:hypothetical protein
MNQKPGNMKKNVLFLLVLCSFTIQGMSLDKKTKQVLIETKFAEAKKFYFQADLGFAFGTHSEIYPQTTVNTGNETGSSSVDAIRVRLGTGLPMGVAGGFMFNKNLGVELGIEFFQGMNTKIINSHNGNETKELISAPHLGIIPSVVAQIQAGRVIPYVKLGIDIGIVNDYEIRTTDATSTKLTRDYGGVSAGFKTAAGVTIPLSHMFAIFAEVDLRQFSYCPMHGKVVKYEENGEDKLGTLTTREKKWDYVKTLSSSDSNSSDEPRKVLRETHSIDNVGVMFGVKVILGKTK